MSQAEPTSSVPLSTDTTTPEPVYAGPRCTKCEAPLAADQVVCRACGYYASLGITVELDEQWESAMEPSAAPVAKQSPIDEFFASIPSWTWPIVGSNVLIIAAAVAGRLLLPAESVVFEFWGVWQLVAGLGLVAALHLICFVMMAANDTDIGIFDVVVSPLKAWMRTFGNLPQRLWMVVGATNGITLALTAALIVGGIQWDRLWDWGIEAPTKSSLMDAITSAAQGVPASDDDLEESIESFAGQASMVDEPKAKPKKQPKSKPRQKNDCLVIGYRINDREELTEVLIACELNGRLIYGGKLVPELSQEEKQRLLYRLMRSRRAAPLVKTGMVAMWVEPRFPCRISYIEQAKNGRLLEMEWEELLPEIDLPW